MDYMQRNCEMLHCVSKYLLSPVHKLLLENISSSNMLIKMTDVSTNYPKSPLLNLVT